MSFGIYVFHPFKSRRDRWPFKGTRQVAGLRTSFLNVVNVSKAQHQRGRRSFRIEFEDIPRYKLFTF